MFKSHRVTQWQFTAVGSEAVRERRLCFQAQSQRMASGDAAPCGRDGRSVRHAAPTSRARHKKRPVPASRGGTGVAAAAAIPPTRLGCAWCVRAEVAAAVCVAGGHGRPMTAA